MASPLTRRVIASMSHCVGQGQAAVARQIPAAGKGRAFGRLAKLRRLLRRLADRPAERRIFVAAGELNEAAAAKAVAVAARRVAVAVDVGVDKIRELSLIGAIRLGGLRCRKQRGPDLAGAIRRVIEVFESLVERRARLDQKLPHRRRPAPVVRKVELFEGGDESRNPRAAFASGQTIFIAAARAVAPSPRCGSRRNDSAGRRGRPQRAAAGAFARAALRRRDDDRHRIFDEVGADIAGAGDSQQKLPVAGIDGDDVLQIERDPGENAGDEPDHQAQDEIGEAELSLLGRASSN